jgi:hypothetical protein
MKAITEFLIFSIFFFYVNNQVPNDKSINSCGQILDYKQPDNKDQCRGESGDICCFVQLALKADTTKKKRFCRVCFNDIIFLCIFQCFGF